MVRAFFRAALIVLALVIVAGAVGFYWAHSALTEPVDAAAAEQLFEVAPGQSMNQVIGRLHAEGLIRHPLPLQAYGRFRGIATRLQAGRYRLSAAMSALEILTRLVTGAAEIDEIVLTIPEGWSVNDIGLYLERLQLFTREAFFDAAVMQDEYRDFPFLSAMADDTILDGYLFPDTYRILRTSTVTEVVQRLLSNFERRVAQPLVAEIGTQGRTLHQVLTLASIVQGESLVPQMPDVAGVFWKRLQRGMRLESDATVNYVLGTSKRQPTFADVRVAHPYNTYQNAGLPPGPIGNPGLDAIRAAMHPADNPYLFFLHKPSREIVFSRTFAEHLANKARYLD